ncbi:hypothetical protein HK097_004420 [Rhizophlyctis rosea]|uniref:Stc1 domain-containing protein n=1 Tax=Rhizophlyctis rosea TaxID=64517 RepID=A0AAD5SFL2_9FUNG|nr:hypothetical protein HK097_004420 [Rhizophlyctis rosea]
MPNNGWKYNSAAGANRQINQQDLPLTAFSTTQLDKVTDYYQSLHKMKSGGGHEGKAKGMTQGKTVHATCIQCTPKQVNVIICNVCNKEQPLANYSKAQRRMAAKDNGARCLKCVKLRDDLDWAEDDGPGTLRADLEAMEKGQEADDDGYNFSGQGESSRVPKKQPQFFLPPF